MKYSTLLRSLLLVGLSAACTTQERDTLPAPVATLSTSAARTWYEATYKSAASARSTAAQSYASGASTWTLNWSRAIEVGGPQPLVLVPLPGDAQRFASQSVRGARYLVVRQGPQALTPTGEVIELLLAKSAAAVDTVALLRSLSQGYCTGQPGAGVAGTGTVVFYSADYHYRTGRRFVDGVVQPGAVRLGFHARTAATVASRAGVAGKTLAVNSDSPVCMDIYQVMEDGRLEYITSTGDCSGEPPPSTGGGYGGQGDGGWGGDGGGDSGGHGGGGGGGASSSSSTLSSTTILIAPPTSKILDIKTYLKCFDTTNGASFSVYATQPKPGTRSTWTGNPTNPNVGHTFISITQGNITRVIGFYPAGGITPLNPSGPSTLVDDSDHDYSVRIDIALNASQLASLVNYVSNFSNTYNLNNYNCTDFGIGAAAAAGLYLPATQGTWGAGVGQGHNPGDLGQDMRSLTLPAGATRDSQDGQADSNGGGC